MDVTFHDDPAAFLARAGDALAADPVRGSILAASADRFAHTGMPHGPFWFAVVEEAGSIVGLAMRTHPSPPHAGFAATMPPEAAVALADALDARGEVVTAWNGDLGAGRVLCERAARHAGGRVVVAVHLRLFEARAIAPPPVPPGSMRPAVEGDLALVEDWLAAFHHDAEVQGGRDPDNGEEVSRDQVLAAIDEGTYRFWEVDGVPVHLTGMRPPAFGVARIGPVYTPPEHRGRGYAGHMVATMSQEALDAGHRVCLYTDQANPVSNAIYQRLGYERVCDEGETVAR